MEKLRRFLAYYGPHKGLFILDLACALVVAAVDVAFPLVTQYILRTLLPAMTADNGLVRVFVILICCLICAYMMRAVLQFVIGYWGHRLGTFIEADMRRDIFTHIQTLSYPVFIKPQLVQYLFCLFGIAGNGFHYLCVSADLCSVIEYNGCGFIIKTLAGNIIRLYQTQISIHIKITVSLFLIGNLISLHPMVIIITHAYCRKLQRNLPHIPPYQDSDKQKKHG